MREAIFRYPYSGGRDETRFTVRAPCARGNNKVSIRISIIDPWGDGEYAVLTSDYKDRLPMILGFVLGHPVLAEDGAFEAEATDDGVGFMSWVCMVDPNDIQPEALRAHVLRDCDCKSARWEEFKFRHIETFKEGW